MKLCGQCKNRGIRRACDFYSTISNHAERCEDFESKKQTNADRIRSMSDKELAEFIEQISIDSIETISFGTKDYEEIWENKETALKWLQSESD